MITPKRILKLKKLITYIFIGMAFFSCNSQNGPTDILKGFLNYRFSSSQTKAGVLKYVSGAFESKVEEMSDEELKKFLDSSNLVKKKLKIDVKKCDEVKCFLSYILSYKQDGEDGEKFEIDVKKIAELVHTEEGWKINDVTNIKSFIEAKKGLDVSI